MSPFTGEVIVAGHICLDLIPQLHGPANVRAGHLAKIGPALLSTGGAVANTGGALHKLGVSVRLMGKIGDDAFGNIVLDLLRRSGIRLADDMLIGRGETTSYSIVISPPNQDRTFWHCTGANDTFCADDVPYDRLVDARFFHFGYPPIMARMFADGGAELAQMLSRVRERGLATGLDFAQPDPESDAGKIDWAALLQRVLPHVDVVFPSVEELLFMLDRPAFDASRINSKIVGLKTVQRLADRLLGMGTAVAAIKLGEFGLYVRTTDDASRLDDFFRKLSLKLADWLDRELYVPCFRASKVVGTTGSGDCTIGGFIASIMTGGDVFAAARSAVAVGAFSVETADATGGIRPWAEVQSRLTAGWDSLPNRLPLDGRPHQLRSDGIYVFERNRS